MRRAALLLVLGTGGAARADTRLAAVADGATLVGPSGQIYVLDGHGAWVRTVAGGIGDDVETAIRAGSDVIAGEADASRAAGPPFRFAKGAWSAMPIALHAKAVVSRGTRPVAAVGKLVFALDQKAGTACEGAACSAAGAKLPDAPAPVLAIGASANGVAIATEHGVARLDGRAWRPVTGAPAHVIAFAGDRWALVADGAVDLQGGKTIAWPTGVTIAAAAPATNDGLVAAGTSSAGVEVIVVQGGKLARETVSGSAGGSAPAGVAPVGVAMDRDGRIVIALADGHVIAGKPGAWATTEVRDELPPAKPGPAPATSP